MEEIPLEPELPTKMDEKVTNSMKSIVLESRESLQSPNQILEELTDDLLFPGYHFPSTQQKYEKSFEERVVEKYTKHGSLSVFKGKNEMRQFKETLRFKQHVKQLQSRFKEQQELLQTTQHDLTYSRDQLRESTQQLQKMETELREWFEKVSIPHPFDQEEVVLPKEPKLMMQSRYRMLMDQYYVHRNIVRENEQRIPVLQQKLSRVREELETLQSEEIQLQPMVERVIEEEKEERNELQVVAKHRYLDYQKKKQEVVKKLETQKKRLEKQRIQEELRKRELEPLIAERDQRMKDFLMESSARVCFC
jgi:chromosome segregation ATPase